MKVGDRLLITGPTTGALEVTVESMRFNDAEAASAPKGGIITIPVDCKVRINDKVFLVTERRFGEPLRN